MLRIDSISTNLSCFDFRLLMQICLIILISEPADILFISRFKLFCNDVISSCQFIVNILFTLRQDSLVDISIPNIEGYLTKFS